MVQPKALKILEDYYLLPTGMNIEYVDKLLGRVVDNHIYPLQRYEPEDDELVPQKLVKGLMGNSTALESVTETTRISENNEARIKLTDLVRAHATQEQGSSATVSVYLLKTYDMTQIKPNFARLKENQKYLAAVMKLFDEVNEGQHEKRTRLPMITKVLVCEDVEVKTTENSAIEFGGEITAPGTAAATHGAASKGPLDGEVKIEHNKIKIVEKYKRISGGIIVGLAYTWTEIQNVPQEKRGKVKLLDRIKSLFKAKDKSQKMEIVISNNQYGGPFMMEGKDLDEELFEAEEAIIAPKEIANIERTSGSERTVLESEQE